MNPASKMRALVGQMLKRGPADAPAVPANTFLRPGNQWYHPVLGGAQTLGPMTVGGRVVRDALAVLERLTPDTYAEFVAGFYKAGLARYGDAWQYADINTALLGLASALQPSTYLEIGVRRGRSLAMVASRASACRVVACDLFIQNYGNMDNPGPGFVREELARIGYRGDIDFVVGDSTVVLPEYLAARPDLFFDLITVDGDHTARGARADLLTVVPRLKQGGALVFDDVSNHSHPELLEVWQDVVAADPKMSTFAFTDVGFGVAIAVRKY